VFVAAALKADAANSLGALALLAVGLVGRLAAGSRLAGAR
jgi:hypothetical protein